jgi:hypothetical protein
MTVLGKDAQVGDGMQRMGMMSIDWMIIHGAFLHLMPEPGFYYITNDSHGLVAGTMPQPHGPVFPANGRAGFESG